jgi:hypothetical protein
MTNPKRHPLEKNFPPLAGEWQRIGLIGRLHITAVVLLDGIPPQITYLRRAIFASLSLFSLLIFLPLHPMSIIIAMGWGAACYIFYALLDLIHQRWEYAR